MSTLSFGPTQKPESCLCFDNKQCCLNRNHCWPFCSRSWRRRMGRRVGRQVHRRLRRGRIGRRQRHAARRRSCVNETQVRFHRFFGGERCLRSPLGPKIGKSYAVIPFRWHQNIFRQGFSVFWKTLYWNRFKDLLWGCDIQNTSKPEFPDFFTSDWFSYPSPKKTKKKLMPVHRRHFCMLSFKGSSDGYSSAAQGLSIVSPSK